MAYKRFDIHMLAKKINSNLPASERWFQYWWKYYDLEDYSDRYNDPCFLLIPDLINEKYKYIIEVDGTFHESKSQKRKDSKKDSIYIRGGYSVFRIKAYDMDSFKLAAEGILQKREHKKTSKPVVILRKQQL